MDNNVVDCGCDNVVFVNITQSYRMLKYRSIKGRENVYECTRKYWKLNKARADKADFIVGLRMASCVVCTSLPTGKSGWKCGIAPNLLMTKSCSKIQNTLSVLHSRAKKPLLMSSSDISAEKSISSLA